MEALFRAAEVSLSAPTLDGSSSRTAAYFDETLPLRLSVRLPSSVDAATARKILESPALSLNVDMGYLERVVEGASRPSLTINVGEHAAAQGSAMPTTPLPVPTAPSRSDEPYAHMQPVASSSRTIGAA